MIISEETRKRYLFTKKIEFEIDGEKQFVEMREFNTGEMQKLMTAGEMDSNGEFKNIIGMLSCAEKMFKDCVVDSSFKIPTKDGTDERPAKGQEIYDFLRIYRRQRSTKS